MDIFFCEEPIKSKPTSSHPLLTQLVREIKAVIPRTILPLMEPSNAEYMPKECHCDEFRSLVRLNVAVTGECPKHGRVTFEQKISPSNQRPSRTLPPRSPLMA